MIPYIRMQHTLTTTDAAYHNAAEKTTSMQSQTETTELWGHVCSQRVQIENGPAASHNYSEGTQITQLKNN